MTQHILLCALTSICLSAPIAVVTRMPPILAGMFYLGLDIIFQMGFK